MTSEQLKRLRSRVERRVRHFLAQQACECDLQRVLVRTIKPYVLVDGSKLPKEMSKCVVEEVRWAQSDMGNDAE